MPGPINLQVSLLLARELLEACLFITSYFGAVAKSPHLTPEEKKGYNLFLVGGLGVAMLAGAALSTIAGLLLAQAVDAIDKVAFAVELGEGLSKLIAAWFVSGMLFKVPMWFDISNYKEAGKSSKFASADSMGSKLQFCSMLFWNTFREFSEAGIITSTIVLLSPTGTSTLGASVGFGLGLSVVIGIVFYLGCRYASVRAFGIAGTMMAGMLTVGLISGAVHSLTEAYADAQNTEYIGGLVYAVNDEDIGSILASFEFIGLSDYHTRISFLVWTLAMALVPYSVYRHHYLGKPTLMETMKRKIKALRGGNKHQQARNNGAPSAEGDDTNGAVGAVPVRMESIKNRGAVQPKTVNVEFAIPTNTYNAGTNGEIAVKMQLEFPDAAVPKGTPAVSINRVEEGGLLAAIPVTKVERVNGDEAESPKANEGDHYSRSRGDPHQSLPRPIIASRARDETKV